MNTATHALDPHGAHAAAPTGILRWLTTTNHKDIGTMYMTFSLLMFFVGGAMILAVRAELFQPGLQLMKPEFFNQLIGVHALVMIFAALMPAATGFANWMIPLMIGAPDMALPRLNNWGFWLLPPAAILLTLPFVLALFGIGDGAVATGWTLYAPLSVQGGIGVYPALVALTVGMYMSPTTGGELLRPDALAMGWLLWLAQTLMIIVLGGVSLLLTALQKPVA